VDESDEDEGPKPFFSDDLYADPAKAKKAAKRRLQPRGAGGGKMKKPRGLRVADMKLASVATGGEEEINSGYRIVTHTDGLTKWYECTECDFRCEFGTMMSDHINDKHRHVPLECTECDFVTFKFKTIQGHRRLVHGLLGMKCPEANCRFKAVLLPAMIKHMEVKHGGKKVDKFEAEVRPATDYKQQQKSKAAAAEKRPQGNAAGMHYVLAGEGEEKVYRCKYCDYACKTAHQINVHVNAAHLKQEIKCSDCSFSTFNMSSFYTHFRSSHKNQKRECVVPGCNFTSVREQVLQMHLWSKHSAVYDEEEHAIKVFCVQ